MATRSTIAYLDSDNTVHQIYCHWDGYPKHNGAILKEHYNTIERVRELLALGNLSVLAENTTPFGFHTFDVPEEGICIAYGRDRGDTNMEARVYPNIIEYMNNAQSEQFDYLLIGNQWIVKSDSRGFRPF